jgi:Fe-S cluster biogenesis protein NfuA/nitrite reductase/ring-hydroxylating ferredoxin subunit
MEEREPGQDAGALAERVGALGERLDAVADGEARETALAYGDAIIAMYGEGLARIFGGLGEADRERLAQDGVIASLMLMHGLYPVDLETRVRGALDEVRPYLESHGGDVELVQLTEPGVLRLALVGSCDGCAASAATLELAIEEALAEAAPDLLGLEVAGVVERPRADAAHPPEGTSWVTLEQAGEIERGALVVIGQDLIIANVAGTLLAYRDDCAGCGGPLRDGLLIGGTLSCAACERSFDLPRAGREKGGEGLQLAPVPLLRGGEIKVAMPRVHQQEPGCDLCGIGISDSHRHLLELTERRMVCVCETCWSLRSGDPEYRPTGGRTLWLEDFTLPEDVWAAFEIPVGLAFLLRSSGTGGIAALYPSPAGATESPIDPGAWDRLAAANPVLERLEPDAEALVVDRTGSEPRFVIAPIDECYRLVGVIKQRWQGLSGGRAIEHAVAEFFEDLRAGAVAA